jgi:hypothetical protein
LELCLLRQVSTASGETKRKPNARAIREARASDSQSKHATPSGLRPWRSSCARVAWIAASVWVRSHRTSRVGSGAGKREPRRSSAAVTKTARPGWRRSIMSM